MSAVRSAWSCCARAFAAATAAGWVALLPLPGALASGPPARAAAAATDAAYPAPPGTRLLIATDALDASNAIHSLERLGFRVAVALPPRLYYVIPPRYTAAVPPGFELADAALRRAPGLVTPLERESAGLPASPTTLMRAQEGGDPFGGRPDLLEPLRPPSPARVRGLPARASGAPGLYSGTRWGDTSEFMVGRVAVGLLFPESDGTVDPNLYDWTPALRDSVIRSTITGLARWSTRAASRGIPLTYVLEVHLGLATRYEPIERTTAGEALWISDVLAPLLGHGGGAADLAYELANAERARLGAEWAMLLFAVQNATDPDGAFPDGYISHARLGGPWIVLPVNNLNSQSARLDYYVEHETAHMFWALDEYPANGAWWACTLTTGYFGYPNTNSQVPSATFCAGINGHVQCLMDGNYPGVVCAYTEGQIGWADNDQTGTPDLLETRPDVLPDSTRFHALAGTTATTSGIAVEAALPNKNPYRFGAGDSISVATVDSIWMRVDGGSWSPLEAADGRYDAGQERFTGSLTGLLQGNHLVEWLAWNSNGKSGATPASSILEVVPDPTVAGAQVGLWSGSPRLVAGPSPASGSISFSLAARPGAHGQARVFDAGGRVTRSFQLRVPASGRLQWSWDGTGYDGRRPPSGLYFLVVELGGERMTRRLVLLR